MLSRIARKRCRVLAVVLVVPILAVLVAGLSGCGLLGRSGPELAGFSVDISEGWKFRTGDDPERASAEFDDGDWESIAVGRTWEEAGYEDYDGYGWYRLRVRIPAALRDAPAVKTQGNLLLLLGAIDDSDETFFNGVKVGETGEMAEQAATAWNIQREYSVPIDAVRWGEENVVAVRVLDTGGGGGMYEGPYRLGESSWEKNLKLKFGLGGGDGIYPAGASMGLAVEIENVGSEKLKGVLDWHVETDAGLHMEDHAMRYAIAPGVRKRTTWQFDPPRPGFYRVTATFADGEGRGEVSESMVLGYAPEQYKPELSRPDDFDAFWEEAKRELAAVDPRFKLILQPEKSRPDVEVYVVEMHSLGDVLIRGWYEKPVKEGPHPALLRVPGYTGGMQPMGGSNEIAVLSLNIRGHGNSMDDVPGILAGSFLIRGLRSEKDFFYRGAYMDAVRGVDFLASRPEVDVSRIAVTGGSQGGALSFSTAALDSRIMAAAPDIPAFGDVPYYMKVAQWPVTEWIDFAENNDDVTIGDVLRVLSYFDTANLAGWIECPVFMGVGLQDLVCPPAVNFAALNHTRGEKAFRVYPHSGHGLPRAHWLARHKWLRNELGLK